MGHSFGSIHILKALSGMTLGDKRSKVAEYISIGAPFLGSVKAVKEAIAWDDSLVRRILNIELGFGEYCQKMLALSSGSIVNFLPRTTLDEFRREPWMRKTLASPPDWLPTYGNFSFDKLSDYISTQDLITIANQTYAGNSRDMRRLFTARNSTRILRSMKEGFKNDPLLFLMKKPDVNTTVIFSAKYPTESKYTFSDCADVATCSNLPNVTQYIAGDETVTVLSAVLPALKWIA